MKIREPHRATRHGSFELRQAADVVFPLFCPVREGEWLESWNPGVIYSNTGVAEPECVFTSPDRYGSAMWLVSHYDPAARAIHMVKIAPELTACLLKIGVRTLSESGSEVSVTYSHTAISPAGKEFVDGFSEAAYSRIMAHWKAALEYFFEHGSPMPGS